MPWVRDPGQPPTPTPPRARISLLGVPGTPRRGSPRSPSALRSAAPDPRAPTPSCAGQTSTPSCGRRPRRPPQSPPRARQTRHRPPLPYWGKRRKDGGLAHGPPPRSSCGLSARRAFRTSPRGRLEASARRPTAPRSATTTTAPAASRITREPIQTRSCPSLTSLPQPAAPGMGGGREGSAARSSQGQRPAPAARHQSLPERTTSRAADPGCGAGGRGAAGTGRGQSSRPRGRGRGSAARAAVRPPWAPQAWRDARL